MSQESMTSDTSQQYEMTLDPPGRIAVIGAGVLGLEAALYGRFLGYDVFVFERGEVGQSLRSRSNEPLPVLPSGCLSSLALAAITAQDGGDAPGADRPLPITVGQWISQGLERLAQTDLLRGRVLTSCAVTAIELVDVDLGDSSSEDVASQDDPLAMVVDGEVPPDFRLLVAPDEGQTSLDFEAVILATGDALPSQIHGWQDFIKSPYFFCIGQNHGDWQLADAATEKTPDGKLRDGYRQIVDLYAKLGGRSSLDLYRPKRL
jgi:NADPH-dependent 2,4-dienoyl-CoA reductase/sulfur reductase-like enzyme